MLARDELEDRARKAIVEAARKELARRRELSKLQRKIDSYYPDEGPYRRALYAKHLAFFEAGKEHRERAAIAANRVGKALKHGTRVATPKGWRCIEDLRFGDEVYSGEGRRTRIVGVYPQGEVDLYDVKFEGGKVITTCGAHLWKYQHPRARYPYRRSHGRTETNPFYGEWVVGPTRELAQFGKISRTRAVVPAALPFAEDQTALPLDPYVLGVLLGDGGLSRDSIKLSSNDREILDAVGSVFVVVAYKGCDYGVRGAVPVIRSLGLLGLTSDRKFIPEAYLRASADQRLALLQGLMDTDGHISAPNGAMEYATCSDALADGFEWLAISLGMKVRRVRRQTKCQNGRGLPSWRLILRSPTLCPFRLARKVERWRPLQETGNWVVYGVEPAGRGQATCIEVDDPSHTFVIEHGIVTHNTEGIGGYEVALHLTGEYPEWWPGRRWNRPVNVLCGGDTGTTTRDILVGKLLGPPSARGTGLIPGKALGRIAPAMGIPNHVDFCLVRHKAGGYSILQFRSYDQKRVAWQGTERDVVWFDEEPPMDIYVEGLTRTLTTGGMIIATFTPIEGMTDVTLQFMPHLAPAST